LSGTSFTTPRKDNQKCWLYRVRPTVGHPPFTACEVENGGVAPASNLVVSDFAQSHVTPSQFRWRPFSMESLAAGSGKGAPAKRDFVQGLATLAGQGSPDSKSGMAIHIYTCNTSMVDKAFTNSDGDLLIVPQEGTLHIRTEFGMLRVPSGHICVVQRGIVFSVGVEGASRGYICEVFNGHFKLPELGPIGANGLANPRDFLHPTADFEDRACEFLVVHKFCGKFFSYTRTHSPFDVVAWHGNYAPYMYDLARFCPVGAVLFDHIDPSVFTVLTAATTEVGVAGCDFVVFPPRWAVQEHTFRPPYYHRSGNKHAKSERIRDTGFERQAKHGRSVVPAPFI
jgi:homogentisate 1,2-dioxygenase